MSKFVFIVNDPETGEELWVTDGTAEGTKRVADVNPGGDDQSNNGFEPVPAAGGLLFATNNEQGARLWVTDGTEAKLVAELDPGPEEFGQGISELTSVDGSLAVFLLNPTDTQAPLVIWVTDGTEKGTKPLQEIAVSQSSTQSIITQAGDKAYFTSGTALWVTDGTEEGTESLGGVLPLIDPSNFEFQALGDKLLFKKGGPNGDELWITDGTVSGTKALADAAVLEDPTFLQTIGNRTYFIAESSAGAELWTTDGTAGGTKLVKDMNEGADGSYVARFFAFGDKMLFWRTDDDGSFRPQLWVSDGTAGGTKLLSDKVEYASRDGSNFAIIGNKVVFSGFDFTNDGEVWATDGTPAGTVRITSNAFQSTPTDFTSLGDGRAIFTWSDGFKGDELWITDGTAAGTKILSDIDPTGSSDPHDFNAFPNAPPTGVTLSKTTINENAKTGTVVGVLGAVDPDAGDTFTYALTKPSDAFAIRDGKLVVKSGLALDFEQGKTETVTIEVTDGGRETFDAKITIKVGDVNPEKATGDAAANRIIGGAKADMLKGLGGKDTLRGDAGDDTLDGGVGADSMTGGKGDDLFFVDDRGDRVVEVRKGGRDDVRASIDYTLGGEIENLTLTGSKAVDGTGNEAANDISGNGARNVLDGKLGNDMLEGGRGKDTFVFSTKLGKGNVDEIGDFSVKDDTIFLDRNVFDGLKKGDLQSFVLLGAKLTGDATVIYDKKSGALLFDEDGKGDRAAVKFADLDDGLTLTVADFAVF